MVDQGFQSVNIPKNLLERLGVLYEKTNEKGYTYISSRAEAVKRAVEHYITLLDSFLEAKEKSEIKVETL